MNTTKFIGFALLFLFMPGVRGEPFRTDINPALLYYQAFLMAQNVSQADKDYLGTNQWQGQKLPERFGEIVAGYDRQFKLVREAAQQKVPCDWGADLSQGPETPLGHLAPAKAIAQTAQLRAMWDLQQGNQIGARDDLLAAFVLGRNVSRDGILISALVQYADQAIVYSTVAGNFGRFSGETLKQLVDGFDAAPAQGTVAAAIRTEKLVFPDWFANKIREWQQENPGNDAKVMETIRGYADSERDTNIWQRTLIESGGTSDGVLKLIHELDPLYARLAKIMTLPLPEYEDKIQKFDAEIQKSKNPLVPAAFPKSFQPAHVKEFRSQVQLAMVRAAVEYKLHGEAGLKSVMDPLGKGPFAFQRFVFEGVDRGFELKSAYAGLGYPCALIFVEKEGTPFYIDGSPQRIGKAVQP
jgi:hypothetical protein